MIKKIAYVGAVTLLTSLLTSCEKDFTEVGSTIIDNSVFTTKELVFDVEVTQENIEAVNAGNVGITNLGEYLLGVYKKDNAKSIEAGIVSQLLLPLEMEVSKEGLEEGEKLSESHLDEIILKIPLKATLKGKVDAEIINDKGETETVKVPDFEIDSFLGDAEEDFSINVYRNGTYLSLLDLRDNPPSKNRKYMSNEDYIKEGGNLNLNPTINFKNIKNDTTFVFDRKLSNGETFKSTLKVANGTVTSNPFIAIKLDKNKLKEDLFDKYGDAKLSSQDDFNEYFKGIIIEAVSGAEGGAMVPLNLAIANNSLRPSLDIMHTTTILDSEGNPVKDDEGKIKRIESINSFYFGGVRNSAYKMSSEVKVPNSVVIQGTAGTKATIKILNGDSDNNGKSDLEELREKKIIINDASLVFDVNSLSSSDLPQRLFLYKNEDENGDKVPTHLSDMLYDGPNVFGGVLNEIKDELDNYTFKLTRHITEIVTGKTVNSDLTLKVFNAFDTPTQQSTTIRDYNWNPRSVILLNNSTEKGTKKGVKLKIIYTEEKTN